MINLSRDKIRLLAALYTLQRYLYTSSENNSFCDTEAETPEQLLLECFSLQK